MSSLGLFIFICVLSYNGAEGKKSFKTRYGDIYDCVDFYKQPSFDHPMLKNHSFHPLMKPSFRVKSTKRNTYMETTTLKGEGCPIGFVPIRRATKGASRIESFVAVNEPSGTYDAGVRTISGPPYAGGGMFLTTWNPPFVRPKAYSQARMKVSNGPNAMQVGWRVDPSLRGDNRTRLYIYTDIGQSHCFDAQCGFVIVNTKYPLDSVIEPVSQPGGQYHGLVMNITRDQPSENWWLIVDGINFGFWPKNIFAGSGLLASNVEWAGEVYSPPGVKEPVMGSGYKPDLSQDKNVAYIGYMTVVTESYVSIDADDLEEFATDRSLYNVKYYGNVGPGFNCLARYGGARY